MIVDKFFYSCVQVAYWKLSVAKEGDMTKGTRLKVVNAMAIPNLDAKLRLFRRSIGENTVAYKYTNKGVKTDRGIFRFDRIRNVA